MDTRRDFLRKTALLTAAASLPGILPASIQKAMAIDPAPGSTYLDAEHIVILMQENRSFDHMYGTLKGVRGYNDPRAITLPNKNLVWLQSNNKGETYAPFHLDLKNTKSTWMSCLPHNWDNQVNARNDGKFDKWLEEKRSGNDEYADMPLTLGHNKREDVPFYYALADAFTVCDQNFCSSLTGTDPNRLYFWSGTIREKQDEHSRPCVYNDDCDFGLLKWTTYPERLEDNGVSWKCYQNEVSIDVGFKGEEDPWLSNFGDNPLENFAQYNILLYKKHVEHLHKRAAEIPAEIAEQQKKIDALSAGDAMLNRLNKKLKGLKDDQTAIDKELTNLQPGAFEKLSQREKNLHNKAFSSNHNDPDYHELVTLTYDDNGTKRDVQVPKGDVLHQFRHDVITGNLPTVSWITAPQNFSDHPSAPWYGAWYLSEVIDILTKDPEVWKKTIFILAYDENDGYFDHVPPFTAPHSHKDGTGKVSKGIDTRVDFVTLPQELERKGFPMEFDKENSIGLGYRVPLVIASPWSRGGWVNSEVFDHTSTLQFLEKFLEKKTGKKITETNISDWRRNFCGDLTSVFRPYNGEKIAEPEFLKRNDVVEYIHNAKYKKLPDDFKLLTVDEIKQINTDPHSSPYFPKQEPGIKPSCALPYQLYADGKLSADGKSFEIKFSAADKAFGKAALGSPFNVYAPGKYKGEDVRTWAYGVAKGDTLADAWSLDDFENNNYHLRVYGPNGFFREFAGNADEPSLHIACNYQQSVAGSRLTGNIELKLHTPGKEQHTIEITDNAYKTNNHIHVLKVGSVSTLVLNLKNSHGWYDFTVRVKGNGHFMKRYAGRVETALAGFSDPFMGRVV
jgi:phospholipase C